MFNINPNRTKRENINEIFSYKPFLIITPFFIMIFIFLNLVNAYNVFVMIMIIKKKSFFLFCNARHNNNYKF